MIITPYIRKGDSVYKYDIALSYASEQKDYVSSIYKLLELKGLSVYFAPAYQEELSGADMTTTFYSIFHDQCLLIAAFVSEEYLQKRRPMAEAAIGQMRNREEGQNCLIPVYFGNAKLPEFDPDINFLDANKPAEVVAHYLAEAVRIRKAGAVPTHGTAPQPVPGPIQPDGQAVDPPHIHINGGHVVLAGSITNSNIQCMNGDGK